LAFNENVSAIILAAGKGVRMKSDKAKVLHEVAGRPMVSWVCSAASAAGCQPVVAVIGYQRDAVEKELPSGVRAAVQEEQLGTGHAVICAREELDEIDGYVVVLCGDVPLLKPQTIRALAKRARVEEASCVVLTTEVEGEHTYGRIVRGDGGDGGGGGGGGEVLRIVEHKDATEDELRIKEVNTGTYCFATAELFEELSHLGNDNAQGEYYLTDVIGRLRDSGKKVLAEVAQDYREVTGVDSPEALERIRSYAADGLAAAET